MGLQDPKATAAPREPAVAAEPVGRNFGLSSAQFDALLDGLRGGDESLFERAFLVKFEPLMGVLKKNYRAAHADAYDAVMWSMLRFREYLVSGKIDYGNLEGYLHRIVVNHFLKKQERDRERPDTDGIAASLLDDFSFLENQFSIEELDLLDRAWELMCDRCRSLLQAFYYDNLDHRAIAERSGYTNEAAARQRKKRCVDELRGHFFRLGGR